MKTPNIWDFPSKITQFKHLCAEYSKNSVRFSKKSGNLPFCVQILTILTYLWGKSPKNQDFPRTLNKFLQISAIVYVGLQGYKSKYLGYHTKNHCSINLQNKSHKNYHNYCRKHQNSSNSVPHTMENIQFKNCEKFSPTVKLNLALSQVSWLLLHQYC